MFARSLKNKASSLLSMPVAQRQQIRRLNLHEYQSMEIMKSFGVATPQGIPADTPEQADAAFKQIKGNRGK
jgi:acyl-CoA synthetase (NDP forming)